MPFLNDRWYQMLKWIVQIFLPAFGALYYGLGKIWGFPHIEDLLGSIAVIGIFLGTILGISTSSYNKSDKKYDGSIDISTDEEKGTGNMGIAVTTEPEDLAQKKEAKFKVNPPQDVIDLDAPPGSD